MATIDEPGIQTFARRSEPLIEPSFFEPLFKRWKRRVALSENDKAALRSLPWTVKRYPREAYLAREGEPTKICMVLLEGFALRQKLVSDGSRQIISFHIPGDFLDIQNCMLEVADHNVQSLGRSVVAAVPKEALGALMAENAGIRRAIWLDSLIDSAIFREWVVNVGRRDARGRIAHLLCELAARLRAAGLCSGPTCDFPMTQEQIADATGLTAVHTNRTLQSLRKDGLISLSLNKLTILDWDKLAEEGDFNERYLHHSA
ncbi:Crp/Fnr family transcriptional regulator [Sphingomonas sp. RG327]|uniref:Crp/Fnr family transcriptional regulator n=1 Tax=Sphingomonas anseongensis TaxID=2908207 RepID=A0ABT0REK1_9SPHN|nr:Crp/Fnr family transcriptional regulator [Sphingomonas anseongensis]MCL6678702.1 Crp/Fnr family transcriptional regulator [Sphingomonas anseongensis]